MKKSFTIGSQSKQKADYLLDDDTVSGLHAKVIRIDDRRYFLSDLRSTNGTFRLENGRWVRIMQANVSPDDKLRFGGKQTTLREVMRSKPEDNPVREFLDSFFKIKEIQKYLKFAVYLLHSPVKNTMEVVDRGGDVNPFSFMGFGFLIFMLSGLLEMAILRRVTFDQIFAALMLILFLTFAYSIITYRIFADVSKSSRTLGDFLRMNAVFFGLFWVVVGLFDMIELMMRRMGIPPHVIDNIGNVFAVFIILYIILCTILLSKNFWDIPYGKVVFYYSLSVLSSFASLVIVLALIFKS